MPNRFDAVMFDLDGTLADTLADIAAAGNYALGALGRPAIALPRYRYLAGQGLRWLITEALGPGGAADIDRGVELFRAYYAEHSLDQTGPFAGVPDLLDALAARGVRMAVLSNKPDPATQVVVAKLFPNRGFDAVRGHVEGTPLKPDPSSALSIASSLGIPPPRWLYVGDTRVDMETARAAGFFAVGVLWGFRDEPELREAGADAIIAEPAALLELL